MIAETVKAWAAGIVDGEGTVMIANGKSSANYFVLVCVANNDEKVVDILLDKWSGTGNGTILDRYSNGKTYKVTTEHANTRYRTSYKVIFNLQDSVSLLGDLLPYLVSKHDNAVVILEAINLISHRETDSYSGAPLVTIRDLLAEFYNEFEYLWSRGKRRDNGAAVDEELTKVLQSLCVKERRRKELAQFGAEPSEPEKESIGQKRVSLSYRNLRRQLRGQSTLQPS